MQNLFEASVGLCLLLSLGHAASVAKSDLQQEHCSWGAQYWCSSPETANLCGKTEWCAQNDWPFDVVQDSSCTTVQTIVKTTRSLIQKSAQKPVSEYDFAMFLARSCTFFDDDRERRQCKDLVTSKDVLPKLVQLVDSKLSLKAVALAVGMCQKSIPKDKPCLRCPQMVSGVQKLLSKFLTQDAFMKLIEPQCVKLGQGRQLCQTIGLAKYADFYSAIVNAPTTTVCQGVPQCLAVSAGLQSVQASTECDTCKIVVKEIRELDRSPNVQAVLQNLIKSVCAKLGTFAQVCDILADEGLEHLSELIATEMEPDVICEELKLCGQPEQKTVQISSPVSGAIECAACEFVFHEIAKAVGSNTTQEQLEKLVTSDFCNRLPAPINGQCRDLVATYSPQLFRVLVNDLDPKSVCTKLGLCNYTASTLQFKPRVSVQSNTSCSLCKYVVTFIDTFLQKNATEAEIEAVLDKVCALLPQNYSQECVQLVQQYGHLIVNLLIAELEPEKVCEVIGLCPPQKLAFSQVKNQMKQPNDEVCDLCKYVVTYLDTFLDENSTQAEIEKVLDEVCQILPTNWGNECKSLVQAYGPLIIQLLIGELQPKKVCELVKFCPANKQEPRGQKPSSSLKKGELCPLCLLVFEEVYAILEQNATKIQIEGALDKVCNYMPATIRSQCDSFVALYLPYVVDLIVQELPPEQLCQELGICNNSSRGQAWKPTQRLQVNKVSSAKSGELCTLCIYVFEVLDVLLVEDSTEAEIEIALEKVCNYMPAYKGQCESFVALYTPFAIDWVAKKLTPAQICDEFGLCTNATKTKLHVPTNLREPHAGPQCALCEYVVQYLDSMIGKNATQQEIEAAMDKVCNYLPSTLKTDCEELVANYTPLLLTLLKTLPPDQICSYIGLCSSQLQAKPHVSTNLRKLHAGPQCPLCEYVVQYLDSMIGQNATQQEIEAALDKVCNYLPSTLKTDCVELVANYTPLLLTLLKTLPPDQICSYIGLCSGQLQANLHIPTNLRKLSAGPECALCEYVLKYLAALLTKNATEQEIEAALDQVCTFVPSALKSECLAFVTEYTPQLMALLRTLAPDQVCSTLKLCSTQVNSPPKSSLFASESTTTTFASTTATTPAPYVQYCSACKFAMYDIQTALHDPFWQKQSKVILGAMCSYLKTGEALCQQLVAENYAYILNILNGFNFPMEFCQKIEFCEPPVNLPAPVVSKRFAAGPQCALCEYVIKYLDSILVQNATQQEIIAALDQVCSLMPTTLKTECMTFVAQYAPILVELLQVVSPEKICSYIRLCSSQMRAPPKSLMFASESTTTSTPAPYVQYCSACKFAMYDIQTALHDPFWQKQSKAILSDMCSYLKTGKAQCQKLVAENYDYILNILYGFNFPMEFCQKIEFCEPPAQVETVTQCSSCKSVVKMLKLQSHQVTSSEEINALADSTCNMASSNEAFQCKATLKQRMPQLVQLMAKYDDPAAVCEAVSLCKRSSVEMYKVLRP